MKILKNQLRETTENPKKSQITRIYKTKIQCILIGTI